MLNIRMRPSMQNQPYLKGSFPRDGQKCVWRKTIQKKSVNSLMYTHTFPWHLIKNRMPVRLLPVHHPLGHQRWAPPFMSLMHACMHNYGAQFSVTMLSVTCKLYEILLSVFPTSCQKIRVRLNSCLHTLQPMTHDESNAKKMMNKKSYYLIL